MPPRSERRPPTHGDEPLYSIGAVARMLEVPQSTLRGWEKRYRLVEPGRSRGSHRLYSRNEVEKLRFVKANVLAGVSPADAHRLLANRAAGPQAAPEPEGENFQEAEASVTAGGARIPIHAHYPTFYSTDQGRLRMTLPFLREGLRLGQPCLLAASGQVLDAYARALNEAEGIDFDKATATGALVVVDGPGTTVEEGLAFWEQRIWRALDDGATVIRLVGEMACERAFFSSEEEMMRYELAYNGIAKRFPTVSLCQYDVREFRGEIVFDAFKAHPDVYDQQVGIFLS
jgi:DNA-binding transcriptional MerR regulator